jgi:hypothetical protein
MMDILTFGYPSTTGTNTGIAYGYVPRAICGGISEEEYAAYLRWACRNLRAQRNKRVWDLFKTRVVKIRALRDRQTYRANVKSIRIKNYRREPRLNLKMMKELQE